jgi:hypothetical protein
MPRLDFRPRRDKRVVDYSRGLSVVGFLREPEPIKPHRSPAGQVGETDRRRGMRTEERARRASPFLFEDANNGLPMPTGRHIPATGLVEVIVRYIDRIATVVLEEILHLDPDVSAALNLSTDGRGDQAKALANPRASWGVDADPAITREGHKLRYFVSLVPSRKALDPLMRCEETAYN